MAGLLYRLCNKYNLQRSKQLLIQMSKYVLCIWYSGLREILQTEMKTIEMYATKRMTKENRKRYPNGTKKKL